MALWTPYADEPLDMRKPIKREVPHHDVYQDHTPIYYPAYNGQVSRVSAVSSCQSCCQPSFKPEPLSPPPSPNDGRFSSQPHVVVSPTDIRIPYGQVTHYQRQRDSAAPTPFEGTVQRPVPIIPIAPPFETSSIPENAPISEPSCKKRAFDSTDDDCLSDDPDFKIFERDALRAMAEKNGGTLLGNNPRMRRAVRSNNDSSDASYREQRERNNLAAKQSRDRRKLRELHLALKVSYLKREVASLKVQLAGKVCKRCQQPCRC